MIKLYCAPYSPPSQSVKLTAEHIGVSYELVDCYTTKGDHLAEEYEKLNPQRKIPFIVDEDFKLGESRAIMIYLVEKYGKNSRLLPTDPMGRALVNQAMNFDMGNLYKSISSYYFPVLTKQEESHSPEKYEKLKESFSILEQILDEQDFVAGRNLTIADFTVIISVTTAEVFGFYLDKYKNTVKWIDRVKVAVPSYKKIYAEDVDQLKKLKVKMMEN
ncbi:hypothetical protein TKK_0017862 [Trichogramma kaykai]